MIEGIFYKDKRGNIGGYRISGHSRYDVHGRDIVCAAVSALAQTTLIALVEVCEIDQDTLAYQVDEEKGIIDVRLPDVLGEDTGIKVETVLRTLEIGIKSIIESYPDYVTLKYREV